MSDDPLDAPAAFIGEVSARALELSGGREIAAISLIAMCLASKIVDATHNNNFGHALLDAAMRDARSAFDTMTEK